MSPRVFRPEDVLKVTVPRRIDYTFLPVAGKGKSRPVKRVTFLKNRSGQPLAEALNPRRCVTRYHLELLDAIDGRRDLRAVTARAAARGVPAWWLKGPGTRFLQELDVQGVLSAVSREAVA